MIEIKSKKKCTGCGACEEICAHKCITMKEDNEGFLYPHISKINCINCGLCEKVCPVLNPNVANRPYKVYAIKHSNDEIRMDSSSGGAFTLIAEQVLNEHGVVFGARFDDNWNVVHDYIEHKDKLFLFRGSKYVQSKIGNVYKLAKDFLLEGRKVLFSGAPCQIAGLKHYLRKDYDNLLTVDFVCHGVPSPKVWRKYLKEVVPSREQRIEDIKFRSKIISWEKFCFVLKLSKLGSNGKRIMEDFSTCAWENPYMKAFLSDLILRPSCYYCPARNGKSGSDITLADFWGINKYMPEFNDGKGVSVMLVNNHNLLLNLCNSIIKETSFDSVLVPNQAIIYSPIKHHKRSSFFKVLENPGLLANLENYVKPTFSQKIHVLIVRIYRYIKKKINEKNSCYNIS